MRSRTDSFRVALGLLFAVASATQAQTPVAAPSFTSIPAIPFDSAGLVIQAHAEPEKPFTVAGERGVLLGHQDGSFEAWLLPVKLISNLTIEAEIEGYTVPIDVNQQAAEIEVRPDRTVITYTHIGFTVRQIMFSPSAGPAGTGPVVLFEFDCLHPTDFTLRFTPELRWMWPERNEGVPGVEWVSGIVDGKASPGGVGGFYALHTDYPDLAGAITIPGARPGILAPYQERPHVYPVELKLHIDPARDQGRLFPLLMAVGDSPATATNAALGAALAQLNTGIAASYQAHAESWKKLLANSVSIETPDKALNEAFQWAVVSIEQLRAHPVGARGDSTGETALVAGYYESGDSARPGFGWFFGRDSLYTLYAVNGYGDFALSKDELEFLIRRQRADGKIMHEYSQTAAAIDWQAFPYMYAAADSTPLFLLAVADYVKASGNVAFLTTHRDAIEKAWTFETDPAHDTDHDGIYDNSQGTGWVESWPGGMPRQEIYLALLDQQASGAMAEIEDLLQDREKAGLAQKRAASVAKAIEDEYYMPSSSPDESCYAFSHDVAKDGSASQDRTKTVYPALAWWSGSSILAHPVGCLRQFAGHALNTDWGLRDVANDEKIYDGMSYHQGSVWPLFTGWAALAEYRGGQPLAGYQLLMENANLNRAQDLGGVTELLSGDFFVPFGRSTSHQLWSSAMVITPTLRGLFGISIDAQKKVITVNPHLPASWDYARIDNLPLPGGLEALHFTKGINGLTVELDERSHRPGDWTIRSDVPGAKSGETENGFTGVIIPRPPLEIAESVSAPLPGARATQPRVVSEKWSANSLTLVFEGKAGDETSFGILRQRLLPHLKFDCPENKGIDPNDTAHLPMYVTMLGGAERDPNMAMGMLLHFPPGEGWKTITVTLTW
jgi:glycogen debranching enzyme